ncbi:EamA family transporter [Streptomyces sp. NPDC093598]|uniref:EamA family transporter n=1 Tax=Streptomyces sp. NPDC093598 TaxID=3366046 RepID=UPI0037F41F0F
MRPPHLALAVLVAAVWGVNFTVMEIGLDHFPPLLFSALRFLAAALPAVFFVGRPKVAWKWIVAVGLVLGVAKFGLLSKAAPTDALNFMVWVSTVPVLPLLALSLLTEGPSRDLAALRTLDWQGTGTVLYVAWITMVFGFGAWGFLLRHHPASTVAPFSLLVPVFGMSSFLFLGEPVSPLQWCAAALLVGGVGLTSLTPRRTAPAAAPDPTAAARTRRADPHLVAE